MGIINFVVNRFLELVIISFFAAIISLFVWIALSIIGKPTDYIATFILLSITLNSVNWLVNGLINIARG